MSFGSEPSELLTTRQAAELVGRSPDTIKLMLQQGRMPGCHVDGFWRVRREDVLAWNARTKRLPTRRARAHERAAEMLAEYGSVSAYELAELLKVHVGNARKHLAILANQGRAHRHDDGEWFPGPDCQQEVASYTRQTQKPASPAPASKRENGLLNELR